MVQNTSSTPTRIPGQSMASPATSLPRRLRLGGRRPSIEGLDKLDTPENLSFINVKKLANGDYLTTTGANFVLTKTASTLNRARTNLYEDLAEINFDGIRYRNDICK